MPIEVLGQFEFRCRDVLGDRQIAATNATAKVSAKDKDTVAIPIIVSPTPAMGRAFCIRTTGQLMIRAIGPSMVLTKSLSPKTYPKATTNVAQLAIQSSGNDREPAKMTLFDFAKISRVATRDAITAIALTQFGNSKLITPKPKQIDQSATPKKSCPRENLALTIRNCSV